MARKRLAKVERESWTPDKEMIGHVFVFQEALGMIIGRVVEITPFYVQLDVDTVHARNMSGGLTQAMTTGNVTEVHPMPYQRLYVQFLRYQWPWAHPSTGKPWPIPRIESIRLTLDDHPE